MERKDYLQTSTTIWTMHMLLPIDRFDHPLFREDKLGRWVPLAYAKGIYRSKRLLEGSMQKGWTIMLQMIIHITYLGF